MFTLSMAYFQEITYCLVPNPSLLGDGVCHNLSKYNTVGYNFDGGDCSEFNKGFPKTILLRAYHHHWGFLLISHFWPSHLSANDSRRPTAFILYRMFTIFDFVSNLFKYTRGWYTASCALLLVSNCCHMDNLLASMWFVWKWKISEGADELGKLEPAYEAYVSTTSIQLRS